MQRIHAIPLAGGLAAAMLFIASQPAAAPQSIGAEGDLQDLFHRAYYLEHESGDLEQALDVYRKVAKSAKGELREQADHRARGIAEDLAAGNFANLLPATTIFYAEIARPGEQLGKLLDQLGLLGEAGQIAHDRIAVSPLLIDGALGMRGAAVGVTELSPNGEPNGVVILHPGNLDVVRGMIETALPAGGVPVDPIGGYPAWSIEGEAIVCVTKRLLIASPDVRQIQAVVGRLGGEVFGSLGAEKRVQQALGKEHDALMRFYVNAEPVKPMLEAMIQQQARNDPGIAMAAGLLDIDSLQSFAGRIGVDDDGISMECGLQLDEGHRNVVFNLLRRPNVGRETLKLVPKGAAFFLATAFNPQGASAPMDSTEAGEVVTLLDFGRELFGNLIDVAVFGMPPVGGGSQIPDVACVMRVNDTERTRALWSLVLGIAGGQPQRVELDGTNAEVERYDVQGVPVYVAVRDGRVVVSPSQTAVERAFNSQNGKSILDDGVFASSLAVLEQSPTVIAAACPGRCAAIARGFMPAREAKQMEPYARMLEKTVVSMAFQHSDTRLAFGARVHAIPDVSALVTQAAMGWKQGNTQRIQAEVALQRGDTAGALEANAVRLASQPSDPDALVERFDLLALHQGDAAGARELTERIAASSDDPQWLNNFAWALLTEEKYGEKFDTEALVIAKRSNKLSEYSNWFFLDTLALALFRAGEIEGAVELQERAVSLAGDDPQRPAAEESLELYRAALEAAGKVLQGG